MLKLNHVFPVLLISTCLGGSAIIIGCSKPGGGSSTPKGGGVTPSIPKSIQECGTTKNSSIADRISDCAKKLTTSQSDDGNWHVVACSASAKNISSDCVWSVKDAPHKRTVLWSGELAGNSPDPNKPGLYRFCDANPDNANCNTNPPKPWNICQSTATPNIQSTDPAFAGITDDPTQNIAWTLGTVTDMDSLISANAQNSVPGFKESYWTAEIIYAGYAHFFQVVEGVYSDDFYSPFSTKYNVRCVILFPNQ